jgi:hypothetical protein
MMRDYYNEGYFCEGTHWNTAPEVFSQKDTNWNGVPEPFFLTPPPTEFCVTMHSGSFFFFVKKNSTDYNYGKE